MSIFVIWVDREHAKLFQFSNEKMERKTLQARHHDHHTHQHDQLDQKQQESAFFSLVVESLSEASRILILGPGVAKHHFQTYLMEHQPALAKKIVGCETVDHPTDPQIVALARKFFNMDSVASSA
jgi:stalled ribosome rescue protein Dom34